MTRNHAAAAGAAAVAVAAITSCASGPTRLTHAELAQRGSAICLQELTSLKQLSTSDLPAYLRKGLILLRTEQDQLAALRPPSADEAQYAKYLAKLAETIQDVEKAAASSPGKAQQDAFAAAAKPANDARLVASALGITACGVESRTAGGSTTPSTTA